MVICANFVYFPALKFLSDYTIILIIKPQHKTAARQGNGHSVPSAAGGAFSERQEFQ